jgi:hypothetical protein
MFPGLDLNQGLVKLLVLENGTLRLLEMDIWIWKEFFAVYSEG